MFNQNTPSPTSTSNPQMPPTPPPPAGGFTPQPPPVEDIFSQTETAAASKIGRPIQPGEAQVMPVSGDVFGRRSIWDNKLSVILLVLVGLAIIGGAVWAAVSFFSAPPEAVNANLNLNANTNTNVSTNANSNANVNTDINTNIDTNANTNVSDNLNTNIDTNANLPIKDSDSDGLSDEEEARLGTNSLNFDTDSDGLMDRVEVRIYKSDPLSKDTDGDGYDDGVEVFNGYDPTKTGQARLFNVP